MGFSSGTCDEGAGSAKGFQVGQARRQGLEGSGTLALLRMQQADTAVQLTSTFPAGSLNSDAPKGTISAAAAARWAPGRRLYATTGVDAAAAAAMTAAHDGPAAKSSTSARPLGAAIALAAGD